MISVFRVFLEIFCSALTGLLYPTDAVIILFRTRRCAVIEWWTIDWIEYNASNRYL